MKLDEIGKMMVTKPDCGILCGTVLAVSEPREIKGKNEVSRVTDVTLSLSKGSVVRIGMFDANDGKGGAPGAVVPSVKFGQRVVAIGVRIAVNDGWLNVGCEKLVTID